MSEGNNDRARMLETLEVEFEAANDDADAPKTRWGDARALCVPRSPGAGVFGSAFNVTNTVIGAGILSIPFGFSLCGTVLALVLVPLLAVLADYTISTLLLGAVEFARLNGSVVRSYGQLGAAVLGPVGELLVDGAVMVMNLGACTAYLVIVGDVLPPLLEVDRDIVVPVVALCLCLPLTLPRHVSALQYMSLASISFVVSFAVIMFVGFPADAGVRLASLPLVSLTSHTIRAVPIFGFAFACHTTVLPIYSDLRDATQARMSCAVHLSMIFSGVMYTAVGICGFVEFGLGTRGDVLLNLEAWSGVVVVLVRIAFAGSVILTFPLAFYPLRESFGNVVFKQPRLPITRHRVVTVGLVLVCLTCAIFVPELEVVFGLTGSTAAVLVSFVLPTVFYMRMNPYRQTWPRWVLHVSIVTLGLAVAVVGTVVTVVDDINAHLASG